MEATYWAPYLAHAAMEPINCVARVKAQAGRGLGVYPVAFAGQVEGRPNRRCRPGSGDLARAPAGGGFGRRLEIDMVEQAVEIAKALDGQAVKLLWSREDDTQHDMYRPAALSRFEAAFDKEGRVTAWSNKLVAQSIGYDSLKRLLLPGGSRYTRQEPDRRRLRHSLQLRTHRGSPGAPENPGPRGFVAQRGPLVQRTFTESFVDELAHAVGKTLTNTAAN